MGIIAFSIPKNLVGKIYSQVKIDNFVETGTYMGNTCFWASSLFKNVYTIEIDSVISAETASRSDCPKNIEFLVGNSKDVLPDLVNKLSGRSFFWLDGHWCFGAGGKEAECPLIDELNAIKKLSDPIIFIDDARCFLGPLPEPHISDHWPRIDEIFAFLKENFPRHFTTIQDDVIMCVPPDVAKVINDDWKERYYERFGQQIKFSKKQLFKKLFFEW